MSKGNRLILGALILTVTGFITRIIGFFYRIFLSHTIGAEGMGIFQLIFPLLTLCYAFTSMGIQTALSNCIASRLAIKDKKGAKDVFCCGVILSLFLSVFVSFFVYMNASWLCHVLLEEPRCLPLVQLMSLSLPFGTLHICIASYYYAQQQTKVPAIAQFLEQMVRVLATAIVYYFMITNQIPITPIIAAVGIVAAETASFLYMFTSLKLAFNKEGYHLSELTKPASHLKEILKLATPLTANRVIIHLLKSVETIMIPARLRLFGMSTSASLSAFGLLSGMALPLILFPTAITNSVAVMLLPAIAESKAQNNHRAIGYTIEKTIKYSLLLGIFSFGLFFIYGESIGHYVFGDKDAGVYIQVLSFLCPFLYLNSTLSSIINGLGKTTIYFVQNMVGLGIRIAFVYFLIPLYGINGYLWGILANEILLSIFCVITLSRSAELTFSSYQAIIKPLIALIISIGCGRFAESLCAYVSALPGMVVLILSAGTMCLVFFIFILLFGLIHIPKRGTGGFIR